jgi:GAF domain-containing protein
MAPALDSSLPELRLQAARAAELEPLLAAAAEAASRALSIDWVALLEVTEAGGFLSIRTHRARGADSPSPIRVDPGGARSLIHHLLKHPDSVVVQDTRTEDRFDCDFFCQAGIASLAGVRIPGSRRPFGLIMAYGRDRARFDREDGAYLGDLAELVGSSIERLRPAADGPNTVALRPRRPQAPRRAATRPRPSFRQVDARVVA